MDEFKSRYIIFTIKIQRSNCQRIDKVFEYHELLFEANFFWIEKTCLKNKVQIHLKIQFDLNNYWFNGWIQIQMYSFHDRSNRRGIDKVFEYQRTGNGTPPPTIPPWEIPSPLRLPYAIPASVPCMRHEHDEEETAFSFHLHHSYAGWHF